VRLRLRLLAHPSPSLIHPWGVQKRNGRSRFVARVPLWKQGIVRNG
jgi:hypothetical protein